MPDLNKIKINGTTYDIADEVSRSELSDLKSALKASEIYYFDDFSKLTNKWIRDTGVIGDAATNNVGYIQCKANTKYTVIDDAGGGLRLSYTNVVPAVTVQTYGLQINNGSVSITTGADATYLTFQYLKTSTTIFVLEVDKDYQFTRKQDVKALTYKNAERILSGADFNDYKTPGNYWVGSGADASGISNIAYPLAGRLTVTTLNNAMAVYQEYVTTSVQPNGVCKAWRLYSANTWTSWQIVASEKAIQIINRDSIVLYDKMALAGVSSAIDNLRKKMPYSIEFANATSPLWLVNYANNTQNCHPKVLYFDSGFGGHKYWMAYTPYPYCNDDYENPCVAYSNDGYHFVNIKGNPLDDPKGNGYNSDTHLVYNTNTGKMELWWRYVNDSTPQETIYRMLSDDGIAWSAKEIVYNNTSGTQTNFESPSVIYENGIYKIWVCTYQNGVVYYEAPENNITSWQQIRQFPFQIQDEGINVRPWHIDVIKENNKYIMAIMCRNGVNLANNICSVFLALSDDNVTYETPYKVISGNVGVWDKVLYRTSIVKVPNGYRLYYTGETGATTTIYGDARWGLGISESNSLTNFYGVCKDTRVE